MMAREEYDNQFNSAVEVAETWIESDLEGLINELGSIDKDKVGGTLLDRNYPDTYGEPGFKVEKDVTDDTFVLYNPIDGEVRGIDITNLSRSSERLELERTLANLAERDYKANIYDAPD
jgi:hypothetical protein